MASLHSLPPLPRSLQGLFQAGSAHWRETERILQMRASIQQDLTETKARQWGGSVAVSNGAQGRGTSPGTAGGGSGGGRDSGTRRTTAASLQATLAHLRREMVSLRQLDTSLLCQLWSLNESIQEYKHLVHERYSETNSECSNYSLENGLDTIPSIEEEHSDGGLLSSSLDESSERIYDEPAPYTVSTPPLTPPKPVARSRTPPKQRPAVPPPAVPSPHPTPVPPPRTHTPPSQRPPPLPQVPPPVARTPPNRRPPVPTAPPRRSKTTPPRNNSSPSLSNRSSTSSRSMFGSDL